MQATTQNAALTLPPAADSPAAARAYIRKLLGDRYDDDVLSSAELCLSELVTNAILHARSILTVDVELHAHGVRLSVADASSVLPRVVPHTRSAVTGRGLGLVSTLSADWGVDRQPDGKVVWCFVSPAATVDLDEDDLLAQWADFDVDIDDAHESRNEPGVATPAVAVEPPSTPVTTIRLLRYPLRRGVRLREHREAVLRECQLMLLADVADGREVPRRLVQLSEMLSSQYGAELSEPEQQKIEAVLRGAETTDLNYPVRPESLTVTLAWRDLLAEIDRFCTDAGLLTLATPPELVELTDWILDEFIRQLGGHPPRPWQGPVD